MSDPYVWFCWVNRHGTFPAGVTMYDFFRRCEVVDPLKEIQNWESYLESERTSFPELKCYNQLNELLQWSMVSNDDEQSKWVRLVMQSGW